MGAPFGNKNAAGPHKGGGRNSASKKRSSRSRNPSRKALAAVADANMKTARALQKSANSAAAHIHKSANKVKKPSQRALRAALHAANRIKAVRALRKSGVQIGQHATGVAGHVALIGRIGIKGYANGVSGVSQLGRAIKRRRRSK